MKSSGKLPKCNIGGMFFLSKLNINITHDNKFMMMLHPSIKYSSIQLFNNNNFFYQHNNNNDKYPPWGRRGWADVRLRVQTRTPIPVHVPQQQR